MQSKADIAREYIDRFPDLPNRTLARKIYDDNPLLFNGIDHARDSVKYVRGAKGDECRKQTSNSHFTMDAFEKLWKFSEGEKSNYIPYKLPQNIKKIVILNDLHIPYHDKKSIVKALTFAHKKDVDAIILNGDIMDCYQLSSFVKDPKARSFSEEIDEVRNFLSELRQNFPDKLIVYKEGNHEERFKKYLKTHAPVIFDDSEYRLDVILRLGEKNIIWVDEKKPLYFGHLTILHGHEYRGGGGVNSARWLFLRTNGNACCGHFHAVSQHLDKEVRQKLIGTWSMGCLCDMNPDYAPLNKWSHSIGYAQLLDSKGNFRFQNIDLNNFE